MLGQATTISPLSTGVPQSCVLGMFCHLNFIHDCWPMYGFNLSSLLITPLWSSVTTMNGVYCCHFRREKGSIHDSILHELHHCAQLKIPEDPHPRKPVFVNHLAQLAILCQTFSSIFFFISCQQAFFHLTLILTSAAYLNYLLQSSFHTFASCPIGQPNVYGARLQTLS